MTDQRIEGAGDQLGGKFKNGLGRLTGDSKLQAEGRFDELKGKAKDAYGRVVDGLEQQVGRAPANLQPTARKGIEFARNKPLLTTGIVAGAAFLLANVLGSRRR